MVEMVEVPLMHSTHTLEGSWEGRRSLQQSPELPRGQEAQVQESTGVHRGHGALAGAMSLC